MPPVFARSVSDPGNSNGNGVYRTGNMNPSCIAEELFKIPHVPDDRARRRYNSATSNGSRDSSVESADGQRRRFVSQPASWRHDQDELILKKDLPQKCPW